MNIKMVAPCLLGTEGIVANELKRMDAENVAPENGRVFFSGDFNILARANICSRYSERILILMGSFKATSFEELFQGVKSLPWEQWIGKTDCFPVKGSSLNSKLASIPDCQKIIKKAVVERLKETYKISWFEETGENYQIQFLILKDNVQVMIDTTGQGLHKRGYRAVATEAPIKETLAAVMCDLSHVMSNHTVVDPCCGSGTILIEAALKALNIAPGLHRSFTSEFWSNIPNKVWDDEFQRAKDAVKTDCDFHGYGYDIDENAIELAKENARKAGVFNKITFEQRNIRDYTNIFERCSVICNPPYGERLLDIEQAQDLYKIMGEKFDKRQGHSYTIISPDEDFEYLFGRKADKRRKLYNGMIKCQVYMYFKN
ncbi:MAG TPA: class I SAM-dependent RNA methyltransferase [Clostridiales bacterium]|nr:class I SAM-dependent RNA methyltransferase [Clostridiales bacterium]